MEFADCSATVIPEGDQVAISGDEYVNVILFDSAEEPQ
jgi:hypothetical protein